MIYDHMKYLGKYPQLEKYESLITEFLAGELVPGSYELSLGVRAVVVEAELTSDFRLEAHKKYLDLHVTIEGADSIGIKEIHECRKEGEYNESDDVSFFSDRPEVFIDVPEEHFVLCLPHDAHSPMIGDGEIKKVIFKIPVREV